MRRVPFTKWYNFLISPSIQHLLFDEPISWLAQNWYHLLIGIQRTPALTGKMNCIDEFKDYMVPGTFNFKKRPAPQNCPHWWQKEIIKTINEWSYSRFPVHEPLSFTSTCNYASLNICLNTCNKDVMNFVRPKFQFKRLCPEIIRWGGDIHIDTDWISETAHKLFQKFQAYCNLENIQML